MPLCDSSTTTCAPAARARPIDSLQIVLLNAEGPVGNEVARVGDGRVREGLTDDRDRHAVDLPHHVGGKHRIAEVQRAHVVRDERKPAGEVLLDHLLDTRGAIGELPVRSHHIDAQRETGVDHVLPAGPQRRGRALPGVAAIQQERTRTLGTKLLHQRGEMREAADLAVDPRCLHVVQASEGMRLRCARRDAEVRQQRLAHQVRRTARGGPHADVHARLAEVQRQQLGVTVGEVQKADVAEARQIVQPGIALAGQRGAPIERQAAGGGDREEVEEFAAGHRWDGHLTRTDAPTPTLPRERGRAVRHRDPQQPAGNPPPRAGEGEGGGNTLPNF